MSPSMLRLTIDSSFIHHSTNHYLSASPSTNHLLHQSIINLSDQSTDGYHFMNPIDQSSINHQSINPPIIIHSSLMSPSLTNVIIYLSILNHYSSINQLIQPQSIHQLIHQFIIFLIPRLPPTSSVNSLIIYQSLIHSVNQLHHVDHLTPCCHHHPSINHSSLITDHLLINVYHFLSTHSLTDPLIICNLTHPSVSIDQINH